jgi:hypothetical protein
MSINFWEPLEVRQLLSCSLASVESPALEIIPPSATHSVKGAAVTVQGITPAEIKSAYGFTGLSEDGAGQTIAIIDAYNDPNITSDLGTFDSEFDLAAPPSFKVVSQTGSTTALPATSAAWAQEISLDVEWAHAIAPDANILLVEAKNDSTTNLLDAVNYARDASGVSVVSMSWGGSEMSNETSYDSYFTTPAGHIGVTFVAASGDEGAAGGAEWPAVSPNVVAVGGTTLNLNGSTYGSESAWSDTSDGTSQYESTPSYQSSLGVSGRTTADVSYDADPNTGFATYDSLSYEGQSGWAVVGGTSAGTPQWSALFALADQGRVAAGEGTLQSGTQTLPALYSIYSNATTYANDFNDITTGSNGSTGFGGGGEGGGGGYGGGGGGGYGGGGGGGFGGGGFGGGGFGGGGFGGGGGYGGGHHGRGGYGRGFAYVSEYSFGYGSFFSAATTTSGSVSLTSAAAGYDGPTGLGTPKAAGLVASLISYGASSTPSLSVKKELPEVRAASPEELRFRPAAQIQPISVPTATYLSAATPSETPALNRPEPRVELETADGLARPSTSAAATADLASVPTPTASTDASIGSLSGFLADSQLEFVLAKVASALKPAIIPVAKSTAALATTIVLDASHAAVQLTNSAAPMLLAPQQMFTGARLDANAKFNDALSSLTDELASIPRQVAAGHSNARAWTITGLVLVADAILLARYRSKRAAAFNDRIKIAI